ncbi:MAG: T9SS type A sorting domain-containing protein [Bacteroidetes bacterium]|nr:T9SS type A sorting domain-containing protein [Bacteroidota bacterium]
MKPIIIALCLIFVLASNSIQGQVLSDFKITPSTPTVNDSVEISFVLGFPWYGARKQKSDLSVQNDTILYEGCYWKPGLSQTESYVFDTVRLGKLSAGFYETFIIRNFVFSPIDTCFNIAFSDTLDTFFVVSPITRIEKRDNEALRVLLIGNHTIEIIAEYPTQVNISIFDVMGRLCWRQNLMSTHSGKNIIAMDMPDLITGVYFLVLQDEKQRVVRKFVKE